MCVCVFDTNFDVTRTHDQIAMISLESASTYYFPLNECSEAYFSPFTSSISLIFHVHTHYTCSHNTVFNKTRECVPILMISIAL